MNTTIWCGCSSRFDPVWVDLSFMIHSCIWPFDWSGEQSVCVYVWCAKSKNAIRYTSAFWIEFMHGHKRVSFHVNARERQRKMSPFAQNFRHIPSGFFFFFLLNDCNRKKRITKQHECDDDDDGKWLCLVIRARIRLCCGRITTHSQHAVTHFMNRKTTKTTNLNAKHTIRMQYEISAQDTTKIFNVWRTKAQEQQRRY